MKTLMVKAVTRILKPLVEILLRHEFSYGEFCDVAKQVYVDVTYDKFSIPSRKTTYARVAVLTGIHRKEVMRLVNTDSQAPDLSRRSVINRSSRVISAWLSDSDFLDNDNKPLTLAIRGATPSFEQLATRHGGDISYGAVLEELVRTGLAVKNLNDTVTLVHDAYVPDEDLPEQVDIFSTCSADLLQTAVHNLNKENQQPLFQRQVVYYHIPESACREFHEYSRQKSMDLLLDYHRWLKNYEQHISKPATGANKRIGVGIYNFENDSSSESIKN